MMDKGIWKILAILMVLVMIGSCVAVPSAGGVSESEVKSSSATIYVPDDYSTIQAAVNAATPGDTIIVRNGTYIENIEVDKSLTIQSENGADKTIVKAANSRNPVFKVTADYVTISGFTIEGASFSCGIHISGVTNCNISNNIVSSNLQGIYLSKSSRNMIFNNTAFSNENCGIVLVDGSTHNQIIKNNASNNLNYHGILLLSSSENTIANNTAKNNGNNGIFLKESNNNRITDNDASNNVNYHGIELSASNNNEIRNNIANFNHYQGIGLWTSSDNNTISNNTAKNNGNNGIFLKESNNNRITDNEASNSVNYHGIELSASNNNEIRNNIANSNHYSGIGLFTSSENIIANNTAKNNGDNGIYLEESNNNIVTDSNASNNYWHGISLGSSSNNTFTGSIAGNNNQSGIYIEDSNSNILTGNDACNNGDDGIYLEDSGNNTLRNNLMTGNLYNFGTDGDSCSDFNNDIDTSNLVDGKPIYYLIGASGTIINSSSNAGTVYCINCYSIKVKDLTLTKNFVGIGFYNTSNSSIENNNISKNLLSIALDKSCDNTIVGNNASNSEFGIILLNSTSNDIYLNNFINNTDNVYSENSTNFWNSTSKITYTYNEKTYTNYTGNYWGDYTGTDTNNNGIGDTPYSINSDNDNYPLMQPWQNYFPEENKAKENTNQKLSFTSYYQPINISVNLSVPPYPLPLNLSNITNIENITAEFGLSERGKELLKNNGFVIIDYGRRDDIVAPYEDMKVRSIPIFVTTDTLLHLYHIQFNEILKGIEEREFFDDLVGMSNAMLEQSIQDYENFVDPEMKEAARRNVAYFAVALNLLQTPTERYDEERLKREIEEWNTKYPWDKKTFKPIRKVEFEIPDYVKDDVDKEIENIEQHDGFHPSAIFNSDPNCLCGYPCCYCEDYSQYVPRGHYTRSEKLKRYFKAMMWYGRMAFLLKGGDDALISEQDAKISTIQAALISSELPDVTLNTKTAQEIWDRIYSVTAFFVGTADDLTPYEYHDALNNVFGAEYNVSELSTEDNLLELKVELARLRSPEIYGGSGVCVVYPPITKEKLYDCLNKTKGMRFMGQRFVPDSYMFDQLVSPAVGMYVGNDTPFTMCITDAGRARCFPRGLDIMAVLGSERAEDILIEEEDTEYAGRNTSYDEQLEELKSQFAGFDIAEWNRNLYWSWLYTLKPLLKQFGDGYPTFMQTKTWQNKELQTSLASWTELRHDTILYAKQSYTPWLGVGIPPEPKPVVGYVEPILEFYTRLLALTRMTENGLVDLDVLNETEKARLQSLERILERLINLSKAELENKELTEDDYEFIRNFGENLDSVVAGVNNKGKETTIVADVHTDCNTGKVLEEGVGYVNLILVAYSVPDGRIIVGAGPVFSYYEFKHPMEDRLTNKKWKEMLRSNPPEKPEWVDGIRGDR